MDGSPLERWLKRHGRGESEAYASDEFLAGIATDKTVDREAWSRKVRSMAYIEDLEVLPMPEFDRTFR